MNNEQLPLPEPTDKLPVPLHSAVPRLEDPGLDADWQALRAGQRKPVLTDSLSSAEKNANARAAEAAHQARTTDQILDS